jgi:hypothetical protein
MYIHYLHQPMVFSALERHFRVTQTFIPLGGAASVMLVAAPTDPNDWASPPEPGQLRAFYTPDTVGLMLWPGTWHALTPLSHQSQWGGVRLPDRCRYPARARAAAGRRHAAQADPGDRLPRALWRQFRGGRSRRPPDRLQRRLMPPRRKPLRPVQRSARDTGCRATAARGRPAGPAPDRSSERRGHRPQCRRHPRDPRNPHRTS